MARDARTALFRQMQGIFEGYLFRHFRWGGTGVTLLPARPVLPSRGVRVRRGQVHEIITVRLADDQLELEAVSPQECPPLGRITLRLVEGEGVDNKTDLVDGPLDSAVFQKIGDKLDELLTEKHDG